MSGEDSASHRYRHWPVILTALLSLAIALVVWVAARNAEQAYAHRTAQLAKQAIYADLVEDTQSWISDLVQVAKLWESTTTPSHKEWKAHAELYMRHHPGCLALERVHRSPGEDWLIQSPGDAEVLADIDQVKEVLLQKAAAHGTTILGVNTTGNGRSRRELIAVPVVRDQEFDGVLVALVDVPQWFQSMLVDVIPLNYSIEIRENGASIFQVPGNTPRNEWAESRRATIAGATWELSVWPKPVVLNETRSKLPEASLFACALLGILLTLAVHLAQQSTTKSFHLLQANQKLTVITEEQRTAEAALRATQTKLAAILENSADAVISLNGHLRITLFNRAAEKMFGYTEAEILGRPLDMLVPERFRAAHRQHAARFDASPEPNLKMSNRRPVFGLRKDGTEFPMDAPLSRIEIEGEKVFTVIVRDITERVRTQEEILRSRDELELRVRERTAELQALSSRMAQLQDEDRRRIARELHDGTTQCLIALNVDLGIMSKLLGSSDFRLQQMVSHSRQLATQCLDELRTVSYLLHPPLLDELGLDLALRNYVTGFSARSEVQVELQLPDNLNNLPRDVQLATFRIVQEALTNIHRHSDSRSASISLRSKAGELQLEISDQGRGIPREVLENVNGRMGIGIASMRERVRHLGGCFVIEANSGTTIRVVLPVPILAATATSA